MKGKVKWYNTQKGYGFIEPDDGTKDVFLHCSALEKAGIQYISDGELLSYEVATNNGKQSAVNIKQLETNK